MNRLESMAVLLAVVDAGSLSAAGRRLGMPLPTVSRKVSALESQLKTRLLIRSTRQLTLTESGRNYVAACRRILEEVGEAERAAAGEYQAPRGALRISAPVVFGRLHMLPVLGEFLLAYPEVSAQLVLGDRNVNLLEEQVDLALRVGPLPDSGLIATHLGSVRQVLCASPAYLAARGTPRHPRDLAAHHCISFDVLAAADAWRFRLDRKALVVPIHPRLTVSTAEAAVDAAAAGLGLTCVLSYQIEARLRRGELSVLLQRFAPPPLPVSLVYASQGRLPLKLRALLDFAAPRLRTRLQHAETALALPPRSASRRRARKASR
jgi:DNA-binding transcriptional LysR family regulator